MVPKLSFQLTQICMALLKRLSCINHVADSYPMKLQKRTIKSY